MNACLLEQLSILKEVLPEVHFKERVLEISGSVHKEPICDNIEEIDVNMLCEKVWPTLAVIGGFDRGLRVNGRCYYSDRKSFGTILGTLKKGFTTAKVMWEDTDFIRLYIFKIVISLCHIIYIFKIVLSS